MRGWTRLLCLAVAGLFLLAPGMVSANRTGSYFAVIVNDIDQSVAWYSSTLALEAGEMLSEEGRYEIINLRGESLFVELLQLAAAGDRPEGLVKGPFKVGFLVDDINQFVGELPASIERPGIIDDEANKLLMIQLKDPDGNTVQVMQLLQD